MYYIVYAKDTKFNFYPDFYILFKLKWLKRKQDMHVGTAITTTTTTTATADDGRKEEKKTF